MARTERPDTPGTSAPDAGIPPSTPQLDGSSEAEGRAARYRQRAASRGQRATGRAGQPKGSEQPKGTEQPKGMVPARERRRTPIERGMMRVIATGGIIGITVILGAVLVGQDVAGWIVGLVVGLVSVGLAAVLWSSRQL